ncbi:MAG: SIR2 family protein, partial [Nitrospinae bacterium]|nr:SIR2 family protein [Nitrospinota bacterium]
MPEHNPMVFISSLGAKLATRSRHVCAFLGAGVGRACGLPDVEGLQQHVLHGLRKDRREALSRQLKDCNLEEALSRIRRISALISGEETVDGLTATKAEELDKAICQIIVRSLSVNGTESAAAICLGAWAARANYHLPVELFTVNYDLLLENALESMRVPYFDGFVGTLQARFHTELVEGLPGSDDLVMPPYFVRLWKLHGSVNWAWDKNKQIVRLGQAVPDDQAAAIYPSDTKYEESRRVPFVVLQ